MRRTHKIVALTHKKAEEERGKKGISEHDPLNHENELSFVINPKGERKDLQEVEEELLLENKNEKFIYHIQLDPFNKERLNFTNRRKLPLVICLADTHHGDYPLTSLFRLSSYLYPIGFIFLFNNKHALLTEKMQIIAKSDSIESGRVLPIVGKKNWLERDDKLLHTGTLSPYHERRRDAAIKLKEIETDFVQFNSNYESYWNKHTDSKFSINISLNGDRNIRFWQSLLAGNLLIQEKLDPSQYLDIPDLRPGRDFYEFECIREAIEIYRKCKKNPRATRETALRATKKAYNYFMTRESRGSMVYKIFCEWQDSARRLFSPETFQEYTHLMLEEDENTHRNLSTLIPM